MFTAYFDESGTHPGAEVLTVAGYLSSAALWTRFDREWQEVLDREQIDHFHMTDFECRKQQFAEWDNDRRIRVIDKLIRIIKHRVYIGVGVAVVLKDYDELVTQSGHKGEHGSPYSFAVTSCLQNIVRWANKRDFNEPINYVFESGAGFESGLQEIMQHIMSTPEGRKSYRFDSWTFATKNINPLQAADILAYETRKHVLNDQLGDGSRELRKSLEALLRGTKHISSFWDRKNIAGLIERLYGKPDAVQ